MQNGNATTLQRYSETILEDLGYKLRVPPGTFELHGRAVKWLLRSLKFPLYALSFPCPHFERNGVSSQRHPICSIFFPE